MNGGGDSVYEYDAIRAVVNNIAQLHKKWLEIVLVVGAGNLRRRRDNQESGIERSRSDYLGMTATVMNAVVFSDLLRQASLQSIVYSPESLQIPNGTRPYNISEAREQLSQGNIVLCSWWVFMPYNTTDAAAVQRALELNCDLVVKWTRVDGVYDKDPLQYDDAVKFERLTWQDALGEEIKVMDQPAMAMARVNQLPIYVCHIESIAHIGIGKLDQGTMVEG